VSESPLFSEHWYRIRDLTPKLANDVEIRRHVYRQQAQYVLHRKSTGSYFRLDGKSFELVGKFDGTMRVDELWELAIELQDTDAPTQAELIQLLAQLHEAELLVVNRRLNTEQLFKRGDQQSRSENRQRYLNPLYMRFRLFDPDNLLTSICPVFRLLFNRSALVIWVMLLLLALIRLAPHWGDLQREIAELGYFSPRYALIFLIVYPLLKMLHELAHGIALKRLGGEVHELGIALMVLLPIPYVDASATAALPDKRHRILVGAAGIMLELTVAALATMVWLSSDGLVHDIALILMLIGGLSTLMFNGNPLLKFDGYYMLADITEIPNLAQRSKQYLRALACKVLLRRSISPEQTPTPGERVWLVTYGILSSLYRFVLMLSIAYLLSGKFFFFGAALAIWVIFSLLVLPCWQFGHFLLNDAATNKLRAILIASATVAALASALVLIPLPLSTLAEGVVWLPERAIIRVANNCEVTRQEVVDGHDVQIGDTLFTCEDPDLPAQIRLLRAELRELEAERYGYQISRRVKRAMLQHKIDTVKSKLQRAEDIFSEQVVRAQNSGQLVLAGDVALEGRYLKQGSIAAFVIPVNGRTVHVPIDQDDIGIIKREVASIEMQFSEELPSRGVHQSAIVRQTPQANLEVISAALTTGGGGTLLADPAGNGRTLMEPVFNVELAWPESAPEVNVGSRVWVKFKHSSKPIFFRLLTKAQRAFLGRLDV